MLNFPVHHLTLAGRLVHRLPTGRPTGLHFSSAEQLDD